MAGCRSISHSGSLPRNSQLYLCPASRKRLTLDYGQPRAVLPLLEQLAHDSLASRVEKAGEPFRLFFTPADIAASSRVSTALRTSAPPRSTRRYFSGRTDQLAVRGTAGRLFSGGYSCLQQDERRSRCVSALHYSYFRDSTGSSCAARVAGRVPRRGPPRSPLPARQPRTVLRSECGRSKQPDRIGNRQTQNRPDDAAAQRNKDCLNQELQLDSRIGRPSACECRSP